jgi:FAD/FMN-containing dehydrogenase
VTSSPSRTSISIDRLRADLAGRVITPGDPDYDSARTVFVGGIDRHPQVIVRPANAQDVALVVSLARETGTELAVRGGGHSNGGMGVSEGGIVIDLRDLRDIDIDAAGRTAWAQTGLTALDYSKATAAHGLGTGFGDTGSVGIGGITLGGGVGYLVRRHGLTIDDLLAAEIVTADGEIRQVDAANDPDLFWAIRGGGGNFGVATRFQYRLHDVSQFAGGMLMLPATTETIAGFIAAAEAAPEELSTIANIMPAPPMPFIPTEQHGKLVVMGLMAFVGKPDAAERALAPFRALATPIADMVHPMPYPEIYPPEDASYHPVAAIRTMFLDHVDGDTARTIVDRLASGPAPMRVAQLRVLGGAMARVPADATAFAHRDSRIMANLATLYQDPGQRDACEAWVADFQAAVQQGDRGAYVNFLPADGGASIRLAYPDATWERLTKVKARYDPANLFRLNQNIPPGA